MVIIRFYGMFNQCPGHRLAGPFWYMFDFIFFSVLLIQTIMKVVIFLNLSQL